MSRRIKAFLFGTSEMQLITTAADLQNEHKSALEGRNANFYWLLFFTPFPDLFFFMRDGVINPFRYVSNCNPRRNIYSVNINILHAGCSEPGKKNQRNAATHSISFILSECLSTTLCVLLPRNVAPLKFETGANGLFVRDWWVHPNVTVSWASSNPGRFQGWRQVGMDTTNIPQIVSKLSANTQQQTNNVRLESNNVFPLKTKGWLPVTELVLWKPGTSIDTFFRHTQKKTCFHTIYFKYPHFAVLWLSLTK